MSAELLLAAGATLLGAIFGSFINALTFRFNTGRSIATLSFGARGRSRCMQCGHTLGAADLIPIFSFVFLQAKCRYCESKLSWQYPLVEVVAALLSLLIYLSFPDPLSYIFWLFVWMVLLFTVVYDIKHTIIPWSCSGLLAVLALISFTIPGGVQHSVLNILAGPLLALPLFLLSLVSRGTWMGWGDSALELSIGWFLGLTQGLTALLLGFWIGAAVGIAVLLLSKGFTMKSEMPFAPFLVLGMAIALFLHVDFFATLTNLF